MQPRPLTDRVVHQVDVAQLALFPGNARRGRVDKIAESLLELGQYRPLVVRRETNEILAGNHTYQAALQLGHRTVLVTYVDGLTDAQARKVVLVDNKTNDLAGYDEHQLAQLLANLEGDHTATGFDEQEVANLLRLLQPEPAGHTDPDDIPDLPDYEPITADGDLWMLGTHRLAVGDACDPDVVALACGGAPADLLLTDPPYNVAYENAAGLRIQNDALSPAAFATFIAAALTAAAANTRAGGACYVFYASLEAPAFRAGLSAAGWLYKQDLVWIKDQFVLSRQDYHWQHEPILYGWKAGAAHRWYGGFTPATLIRDDQPTDLRALSKAQLIGMLEELLADSTARRCDRPRRGEDHPTSKPVALLETLIANSTASRDLVLDPCAGSGSTLIASHRTGRRSANVELDRRYADVICRRWQAHTGVLPARADSGQAHDFIAHHTQWKERATRR